MARYQLNNQTDVGLEGGPDSNYQPSMESYHWYDYLFNPVAQISGLYEGLKNAGSWVKNKFDDLGDYLRGTGSGESGLDKDISKLYDDLTGKSAADYQNKLNRELAEEEYQRNLQSIGDTAAAYEAAGFNRNLLYSGASPTNYSAPNLQAYSGSSKLDTVLSRVGKLLNFIPAMYQATASLEGIDQARERTKQSEIKTMAMGLDLLDHGYKVGDQYLHKPFSFDLIGLRGGLRHWLEPLSKSVRKKYHVLYTDNSARFIPEWRDSPELYRQYSDSSLNHSFDLLESIGIKNKLNNTRDSYLGYQNYLDRKYGEAGRIVGLASQGLGSLLKIPIAFRK